MTSFGEAGTHTHSGVEKSEMMCSCGVKEVSCLPVQKSQAFVCLDRRDHRVIFLFS